MRNKITKKNMDLDLRRYGKMLYSKAEKSGGNSEESEKSERFTLADLWMEISKYSIEESEKEMGEPFPGELLYPDTFVRESANGYIEFPRTAAFPFLESMDALGNAIPAYTNPPTINDNTWAALKFTGDILSLSGQGFVTQKIVTEDMTSHGVYPPRELYIITRDGFI